jgi:hypothetical protein
MREIYGYPRNARLPFFSFCILPESYSPTQNSHLDYNASIDADFLKKVSFGRVEIYKKFHGSQLSPKIENFFNRFKSMKT